MTMIEIALNAGALAFALSGVVFVAAVLRTSGSEHVADPQRVAHLVETAPYDRLDNVVTRHR